VHTFTAVSQAAGDNLARDDVGHAGSLGNKNVNMPSPHPGTHQYPMAYNACYKTWILMASPKNESNSKLYGENF
jgi:hypothetical protein